MDLNEDYRILANVTSDALRRAAEITIDQAKDAVTTLLRFIGEDPTREGLLDTPRRVAASLLEMNSGYQESEDAAMERIMTVFEDGACNEMVLLRSIEFISLCEHHMLPFSGRAHIAYLPDGKIIGISKLARILDYYSRRLQVQERLCQQVSDALNKHLQPKGAACVIEAHHSCMSCRGVGKRDSVMVTSSLYGSFLEPAVRSEFFDLIKE